MKFFIFLSFWVFSSMVFVSCFDDGQCASLDGAGNCIVYDNCKTDGDCIDGLICNQNTNKCTKNPCSWALNNSASCGLGKCVIGNDYVSYYCQCDEGATISDLNTCFPACTTDSDCEEFAQNNEAWSRNKYCNTEKGYCAVVR